MVKQKTARSRFTRTVKAIRAWCRDHRHLPLAAQRAMLAQKLRGHFNYYGITGNSEALERVHLEARRGWQKWLSRRSQRGRLT